MITAVSTTSFEVNGATGGCRGLSDTGLRGGALFRSGLGGAPESRRNTAARPSADALTG